MMQPSMIVDEVDPSAAFESLTQTPDSVLIDVRTEIEWQMVGIPDLSGIGKTTCLVEWMSGPERAQNPRFLSDVQENLGGWPAGRVFFICRSGMRSMMAAHAMAQVLAANAAEPVGGPVHCTNIAEGFEGNRPPLAGPGPASGWKERGLPWCMC
ncbi:MAG: rhodanese-like domain-containing protein [Pseudomonadota bacterium]